jgi:hypothetical protein
MLGLGRNFFGNVEKFKYFRTVLTNQNHIHKKFKSTLNFVNVGTIWFRIICLPFSYFKLIKIYKTVVLRLPDILVQAWKSC